ncbi:MAG: hypothetical protein ACR2GX_00705 [Candidatus Dormibacteria bacterium]
MAVTVYIEDGRKRVFAAAVEWPGWCRSGKNDEAAREALREYAERYRAVGRIAGVRLAEVGVGTFEVVERLTGNATTDFGAPGAVLRVDREPSSAANMHRIVALLAGR